ncbi:YbhN family protein [Halobacteriaceae archaeon GCM10025711]
MGFDVRSIVAGFGAALAVLAVFFWFVGTDEIIDAFAMLDTSFVLLIAAVALVWLFAWGLSLRAVLDVLDVPAGVGESFMLFSSATFANNITPFGQAGGEPFSALLISRATGAEYERGLAAIASVDALNFVPSIVLALLGLSYYAVVFTLGDDVEIVAAGIVALAVGIPVLAYVLWRNHEYVERGVASGLVPVVGLLGKVVPKYDGVGRTAIRHRVSAFFTAIGRVGQSRRDLAVALGFSAVGWLALASALWLSLYALGFAVPVAAVLIAVPVGSIAGITPLPGGLGGVEFAIVLLIVPTTGVSAGAASAAALIYRGATYWLPTLLGGGATAVLEGRTGR